MPDTVQKFLERLVEAEMVDEDHWLLNDVFYKALPTIKEYDMFFNDWESATDRSAVYDWWHEYVEHYVSNEFFREFLKDELYDEHIYDFLMAINDKYETHIVEHYNKINKKTKKTKETKAILMCETCPTNRAEYRHKDNSTLICHECKEEQYMEQKARGAKGFSNSWTILLSNY